MMLTLCYTHGAFSAIGHWAKPTSGSITLVTLGGHHCWMIAKKVTVDGQNPTILLVDQHQPWKMHGRMTIARAAQDFCDHECAQQNSFPLNLLLWWDGAVPPTTAAGRMHSDLAKGGSRLCNSSTSLTFQCVITLEEDARDFFAFEYNCHWLCLCHLQLFGWQLSSVMSSLP